MDQPICFTHSNHPAFLYQDMLADQFRMQCYRRAINQLVKPGDIVADLGTGMGVLAMMAVQAGASHVYAIENRPQVIPITQKIINQNGMAEQITLIEGDARKVNINVQVDMIINELIGDFGTDENILECVDNFTRHHLKPCGHCLPQKLRTYLVPVEYRDEYRGIWRSNFQGLDLSPVSQLPCHEDAEMRILTTQPKELAIPHLIEDIDFTAPLQTRANTHECQFTLHSEGQLQGFMGFFQADLTPDIRLDNYPVYPGCHWQTWHWPLYPPPKSQSGFTIKCELATPENIIAQGWQLKWSLQRGHIVPSSI